MKPISPQNTRLILASASPRRIHLLREHGVEFDVVPSHASELHDDRLTAAQLAKVNAKRKAQTVAEQFPDAIVLGADTLVTLGKKLFGKPANMEEAEQMIGQLEGKTHEVVTGVCLLHQRENRVKIFSELTRVTFRKLARPQIQQYLSSINPFDKAGAYAIQESGEMIVEAISGSYTNVIGLPVERVRIELLEFFRRPDLR